MRKQRLRISLPFLILILTEVILTSSHSEGANIPEDQGWEKQSRAETSDSESSAAEYDVEKNPNGYGKVSNRGNKARLNWRKSDRIAAGKLGMKNQYSTDSNSVNYDQPTPNLKRGSWQCNGVEVPGDQINVVYSDKKGTQWSQNPVQSDSHTPMNFGFPQNLFFPKMARQMPGITELVNFFISLFPIIATLRRAQGLTSNNGEGNFDHRSFEGENFARSFEAAAMERSLDSDIQTLKDFGLPANLFFPKTARDGSEVTDILTSIMSLLPLLTIFLRRASVVPLNNGGGNFDHRSFEGENFARRSEAAAMQNSPDYLKPSMKLLFSKDPEAAKAEQAQSYIKYMSEITKATSDISKVLEELIQRDKKFDPVKLERNQWQQPIQDRLRSMQTVGDLFKPLNSDTDQAGAPRPNLSDLSRVELVVNSLNPFARMIDQRGTQKSINDPTKSRESSSDLPNSLNSDTRKDTLAKLAKIFEDMLKSYGFTKNRRGTLNPTVNDQPNKPFWPMNNGQSPLESNTGYQDVPPFPNNDLELSIQTMANLVNSFMQHGGPPIPFRRIDIDKHPVERPLSVLESIVVNMPYYRLFNEPLGLFDILEKLIELSGGSGKPRSRRSIRETNDCPTIPSDYHRATGSQNAYKLFTNHMSWNDARLNCKIEGAELALPQNQVQYDSMVECANRTLNNSDGNFHVGFHSLFSAENWTTVCGEPLPFEHWADRTAATHDVPEKKCGAMIIAKNKKQDGFVAQSCSHPQPFMCEIVIPSHCA